MQYQLLLTELPHELGLVLDQHDFAFIDHTDPVALNEHASLRVREGDLDEAWILLERAVAAGLGDASKMSPIMADSTKTQLWVNSYTEFLIRWDLDGVDLDWEYPDVLANWQRGVRIMRRAADNVATRINSVNLKDFFS